MTSWSGRAENLRGEDCRIAQTDHDPPSLPLRRPCPDGYQAEGEIFEIPHARGLDIIDILEGNGSFYQRRLGLLHHENGW